MNEGTATQAKYDNFPGGPVNMLRDLSLVLITPKTGEHTKLYK